MLSQTGFTEEVLLDEVGLLRFTGGEAIKTVHTHGTACYCCSLSSGLLETSMEEQDHTPGSG